ncbi:hypothetical protein LX36DRAFT_717852 [Colletotrichum falcatum]|nr:hypothetical protein LX36DRAFT_717852 [Colletotrichum falcatum]
MTPFKVARPLKDDGLKLAKPFSSNDHRALAQEVGRLVKKRGGMATHMAESMKHLNPSEEVQLQQEMLLQIKVLADREKLFELDPSEARARDIEILKSVLSKLRDENQTPKRGRKHKLPGGGDASSVDRDFGMGGPGRDSNDYHAALEKDLGFGLPFSNHASSKDGTKDKKRKRALEATPACKKAKNGQIDNHASLSIQEVSTVVDGQKSRKDINANTDKSTTRSKAKHRVISIPSSEARSMEEGSNQNADACLTNSRANKDHDDIVKVETKYGYDDEAKKAKEKRSLRSKSSFIVETAEHKERGDHSKKPTGQVPEAEKHNSGFADNVKEETMKNNGAKEKKKKKKKQQQKKPSAATTATGPGDVVAIDADEQTGLGELETRPGDSSPLEIDDLQRVTKERQIAADIAVNMEQESPKLRKSFQYTDGERSTANEGNKKTWRRNSVMVAETNNPVSHSSQDKIQKSGTHGFDAAFSTASRALKGLTRIEPPVTPISSLSETAGRTPLNPWSAYRRASIESTKKAKKPQDGQVWILGSRKKGGLEDYDTKIVTMTIGKVDAPTKVDQGSPTPPPKKEKKKKARLSRKVNGPAVPLGSRPTIFPDKTPVPGVRVSEDLVRLITPYAALLGSVERAESLNKLLAKDRELLKEEKKTWFETVGLPCDD